MPEVIGVAGLQRAPEQQGDIANIKAQLQAQEDEKVVKALAEIASKAFDKNVAYNNTLLVAGYAGAFTIWSFTKSQLTDISTIAIALSLVVSLTFFILFEVFKMVVVGRRVARQAKIINSDVSSAAKRQAITAIDRAHNEMMTDYLRYWVFTLVLSIGGALVAVGLLVYNFTAILLGLPRWPA